MSFEGSRRIRRLATELPEAALVLETDAPDMAPSGRAGNATSLATCPASRRNSPVCELRNARGGPLHRRERASGDTGPRMNQAGSLRSAEVGPAIIAMMSARSVSTP